MLEVKYQTVWSSVTWQEYKRLKVSSQVICSLNRYVCKC